MEQVLNAKLRNQAFGKFIIFFVLTVAVIVAAVYFNFRIPIEENKLLRERIRDSENQMFQQEQLVAAMQNAKYLIDSMSKLQQFNPLLDKDIAEQLKTLKTLANGERSTYTSLTNDIFSLFYDYNDLNKKLLQSRDIMGQVEKLRSELNQAESRRIEAERSLDIYRRSNNLGL